MLSCFSCLPREESKLTDEHFLVFEAYPDKVTFALIGAVSSVLGVPLPLVLEIFGEYFLTYCLRHGYDKMLLTLARDIESFIQNLDSLHSLLALTYKNIEAPSFRSKTNVDGTLELHYYSVRPGLYPIVLGMVRAVARDIFCQEVEMEVIEQSTEELGEGRTQEHTVFHVAVKDHGTGSRLSPEGGRASLDEETPEVAGCPFIMGAVKPTSSSTEAASTSTEGEKGAFNRMAPRVSALNVCSCYIPCKREVGVTGEALDPKAPRPRRSVTPDLPFQISPQQFSNAFPYHVAFDKAMRVRQCGSMIIKLLKGTEYVGLAVSEFIRMVQPRMEFTIENVKQFINAVFLLAVGCQNTEDRKEITLKGQMIWLEESEAMIFIGSPRLTSLNELLEMNVFLADIPLYDVTRELVLLNQQRIAEIDVAKKLDETTMELKATSRALEQEKQKTDNLLYQMLPAKVAEQLKNGQKVEAEKFGSVTILFSDIVTFTTIASSSTPLDIVRMLNKLYMLFDEKTEENKVYKVETIGDAYMVVGGIPEPTPDHAERVACFAIDMVKAASQVASPVTGDPIQIRVGVHTGPVVAGVVGVKMPRYCLFGDTVNTASRMESHGMPARVHVSPTSYQAMKGKGFKFQCRGEIQVKGKGAMTTYFLLGRADKVLEEPKDEYNGLPVLEDGSPSSSNRNTSRRSNSSRGSRSCTPNEDGVAPCGGCVAADRPFQQRGVLDQGESRTCTLV